MGNLNSSTQYWLLGFSAETMLLVAAIMLPRAKSRLSPGSIRSRQTLVRPERQRIAGLDRTLLPIGLVDVRSARPARGGGVAQHRTKESIARRAQIGRLKEKQRRRALPR